jgi:hypothetical protein
MSKSLDEIWDKMQKDLQAKKNAELTRENHIFEIREKQRREYIEKNRIFESLSQTSVASAAAGGSNVIYEEYISEINTIWLYPQADLDAHISTYIVSGNTYQTSPGLSPSVTFTRNGNIFSFATVAEIVTFFDGVYLVTEVSQPVGNQGFSCGVGTRTRSRRQDKLILQLNSGLKIVEWALMTQLTSQSSLPVGGNSPDGTVGWSNIYCDWDANGVQDPDSSAALALSSLIDGLVFTRL